MVFYTKILDGFANIFNDYRINKITTKNSNLKDLL